MTLPNPQLSPQSQLLSMLNAAYGTTFTLAQVQFDRPEVVAGPMINASPGGQDAQAPTMRNSRVMLSSAPGAPYVFSTQLYYDRLFLPDLFANRPRILAGAITHTYHLLPQLSELFGFPVLPEDIVSAAVEIGTGYPVNVLLMADPASLILIGQINLTLSGP